MGTLKSVCQHDWVLIKVLFPTCRWLPSCILAGRESSGASSSCKGTNYIRRAPLSWSYPNLITSIWNNSIVMIQLSDQLFVCDFLLSVIWDLHYMVMMRIRHTCMLSCFSCVWLFATPWTVALQDPLSIEFPMQKYWNGLPSPPSGDLLNPWIESLSLMSPALACGFFTTNAIWEAPRRIICNIKYINCLKNVWEILAA